MSTGKNDTLNRQSPSSSVETKKKKTDQEHVKNESTISLFEQSFDAKIFEIEQLGLSWSFEHYSVLQIIQVWNAPLNPT